MLAVGDIAERGLRFFGITKQRVQAVTGSEDCGCAKRQAAMNEWGYRWQHRLLMAVWPIAYRIEMLKHRVLHGRLGRAAMYFKMAVRTLLYGR